MAQKTSLATFLNSSTALSGRAHLDHAKMQSPLSQPAFYEAVRRGMIDAEKIGAQVQALRDGCKTEKRFARACFNLFSSRNPVEKAMADVAAFEKYCHKNGITFDEV